MVVSYVEALQVLAAAEAEVEGEQRKGGRAVPGEANPMKCQIKSTFNKAESKVQELIEVVNRGDR